MVEYKDYQVELPPIDDTCKGGNCGHQHKVTVSNRPPQPKIEAITTPATTPPAPPVAPDPHAEHNHDIVVDHKQLAELMPLGVNFAPCADGSCGNTAIKNSKITKKFKTCTNCNDNGVPNKAKLCPTCGIKEPQDEDDRENFWDDSDIDAEKIEDDED